MRPIRAGQLRHRVTIQKPFETADAYGTATVSWQDVDTVWANVSPIRSREYLTAMQLDTELTHQVRIRYRSDIKDKYRMVYESTRYLDIKSVIDVDGERHIMDLLCTEKVD